MAIAAPSAMAAKLIANKMMKMPLSSAAKRRMKGATPSLGATSWHLSPMSSRIAASVSDPWRH
jgi:hypothetical protein